MRRRRRLQEQPASLLKMCVVSWSNCIALHERRRVSRTLVLRQAGRARLTVKHNERSEHNSVLTNIMKADIKIVNKTTYSYTRFSTLDQQLGDSERRQVALAKDYCARH